MEGIELHLCRMLQVPAKLIQPISVKYLLFSTKSFTNVTVLRVTCKEKPLHTVLPAHTDTA